MPVSSQPIILVICTQPKTTIESDRELENRPEFSNMPTEKPTKYVVSIYLYIRSFDHFFSQHDNAIVRRMLNGLLVLQH